MATSRIDRLENGIINAPMELWQRVAGNVTTVNSASTTAYYTADRFASIINGSSTKNFSVQRSADVPALTGTGNTVPAYSHLTTCLTALTPAAGDIVIPWQYRMEGYDYSRYHGNACTFAFYARITAPTTTTVQVPVAFRNNACTRSYVVNVPVVTNGAYQLCVVNLTMDTVGAWTFDNTAGLTITIGAAAGTTWQASSLGTWQAGEL